MTRLSQKVIGEKIAQFLQFKRALGHKYLRAEITLRKFTAFVAENFGAHSRVDLATVIHAWVQRRPAYKPVTLANELGVLRGFCLFLRRHDPETYVPAPSLAPQTRSIHVPYIFTHDQIRQLMGAALVEKPAHAGHMSKFWPPTLRMLLLVTYCTGMRLGEAVRLQLCDLDQVRLILHVHDSKGRSRDLPFQQDLAREFREYLQKRSELLERYRRKHEPTLLVNKQGEGISVHSASGAIRRLLRQLGMKNSSGRSGPRPYDLRHTYAVHTITRWYQEGADLEAMLPWLSAYMGHVDLLGTEDYLHATPELLEIASKRFAHRFNSDGGK